MASYGGPIFDCDTHLYETPDSWNKYLPSRFAPEWSYRWKNDENGEWALFLGERKIEVSAGYFTEDGRVPPPGKLHEWLKAMKMGKAEIEMRVAPTPDMFEPEARLTKMDEFGVEA